MAPALSLVQPYPSMQTAQRAQSLSRASSPPAKTPKSRSNGVILTFISLLLSPHSRYKIRKAKQKKKKKKKQRKPTQNETKLTKATQCLESSEGSLGSVQVPVQFMARHIADTQTEDRHRAPAAKNNRAPPRAVSVPLDHEGGEKEPWL